MIVVDTTVWIDFFRRTETREDRHLHQLILNDRAIALTDLIYCEILQGIREDTQYVRTRKMLQRYPILRMGGLDMIEKGAKIYRTCRRQGVTVRKTIDCLIASVCLTHNLALFHNDSDFDLIARHTPLQIYAIPQEEPE